jgi:hypothetical protein
MIRLYLIDMSKHDKNIIKRLQWAKSHQHWTVDDWKWVIFSDETKINRFGSDGKAYA